MKTLSRCLRYASMTMTSASEPVERATAKRAIVTMRSVPGAVATGPRREANDSLRSKIQGPNSSNSASPPDVRRWLCPAAT
jgi:hypothetical protein